MKHMYVMVYDEHGHRFNPRPGGYVKPHLVYDLTEKFKVVEVRAQPNGPVEYAFIRGQRVTASELACRLLTRSFQSV